MKERFHFLLIALATLPPVNILAQQTVHQNEPSAPYYSGYNGVKNKDGGPLSIRITNMWHYNTHESSDRASSTTEDYIVGTLNDDCYEKGADLSFRLAREGETPNLILYLDMYHNNNVYSGYATLEGTFGFLKFSASGERGGDAIDGVVVKLGKYLRCGWGAVTVSCSGGPSIEEGYRLVEHRRMADFTWDPCRISLMRLCEPGKSLENTVAGARKIWKSKPFLNLNVLDFLLEHQDLIPEGWKGHSVYFWGTVVEIGGTGPGMIPLTCYVPSLGWWKGKWTKSWGMCFLATEAVVMY